MARTALAAGIVLLAGALWISNVALTQSTPARRAVPAALAAFERLASVLESPRCMNCHPRGDRPSQGDDRHIHLMNVQRGAGDRGLPAMTCSACHREHNNDRANVPGAPHWRLAPRSMGWTGLSRGELCRTLLDRSKNGRRSPAALLTHMTGDELVLWAWNPGPARTPPPLSRNDFKAALEMWIAGSTPCPN
jgi:hypothetical protein